MLQSLDVRPDEAQKENVGHNKVAITSRTNKRIWCLDAASVMCPAAEK